MNNITVHLNYPTLLTVSFDIQHFIDKVIRLVGFKQGVFEFSFVNDDMITAIHKTHLHNESTTDIITFNLGSLRDPIADIYICVDEANRNALLQHHELDKEIQLLIVHGILHVKGFTDYEEKDKKSDVSQ